MGLHFIIAFVLAWLIRGNLLASALAGTGETEPAIERFLAAIRLAPDSADQAHFQLALLLRQSGEFEEAVTHLRQTVRLTPGVARAHYELANTYKALGDSKAALPELRHTVRLAPGFVPAVNDLAWLLATSSETALRDGGEALGLAKSLVGESGPRNHTSFDTMAAACAELGDFDAAVRWQRRAIRDCPDEVRAEYEARLRLYESQTPYRSSAL